MKNAKFLFVFSLLLFMMISCTKETMTPESISSEDVILQKNGHVDNLVPFKANFTAYIDEITHMPPPPPKVQIVKGTGNFTHLGLTNLTMEQSWYPPGPPPYTIPYSGTGFGSLEFVAANGDILLAEYTNGEGYHESESVVYVTFTAHFVEGGTGRFENVTGSFEWDGVYYPFENIGYVKISGAIDYTNR